MKAYTRLAGAFCVAMSLSLAAVAGDKPCADAAIDGEQAKTVLTDLQAIASADGEVSDAEQKFIADTAATFGIDLWPVC